MEIRKTVDLETLTQAEKELIDSGEKTAEDLLSEHEAAETAKAAEVAGKLTKAEELAQNYKIRAEKAEQAAKGINPNDKPSETPKNPDGFTREEAKLYAKGFSDDEVERIKKISSFEGITIAEAEKSDLFAIWKDTEKKKADSEAAQMRSSKGSKGYTAKSFNSKGLTRDEHKELFESN